MFSPHVLSPSTNFARLFEPMSFVSELSTLVDSFFILEDVFERKSNAAREMCLGQSPKRKSKAERARERERNQSGFRSQYSERERERARELAKRAIFSITSTFFKAVFFRFNLILSDNGVCLN